jgi:magnesium chelatase family protein
MPNGYCNSYPHVCPYGLYGSPLKRCIYTAIATARYQKKISGPLLDRIDIHVEVPRVDYKKLADKRQVEDSKTIRARVQASRERQLERFKGTKLTCNAEMGPTEVRQFCQTDASGEKLLKAAVQQLHLSARAYHRVLKLARTIADLAGSEMIAANHVAEAVQYRPRVGI